MRITADSMQLQVWYGVLFAPPGQDSAARPALPAQAETVLDGGGSYGELAGTRDGGSSLAWITYLSGGTIYYGLAVADSVQSCSGAGEVSTCYPGSCADADRKAGEWSSAIARALAVLGTGTAAITWYQTVTVMP